MGFDWFTFAAQILNFLVLVWLLKHFLYGRILAAMKAREAGIARRLEEAAQEKAAAEQQAELFRNRNRELEAAREQFLEQAASEAQTYRQELMQVARSDAEKTRETLLHALREERQELLEEFRARLGQEVIAIARDALKELADSDLEEQALEVFIRRLQTLEEEERAKLAGEFGEAGYEVEVRTAFPLTGEMRERLAQVLVQEVHADLDVQYAVAPELICGIELRGRSHRLVWNVHARLEALEDRVFELLELSGRKDA